jgi:antitoxin PrlF
MATNEATDETTVNDSYAVTIPATIRQQLDLEPGDKIRWTVDDTGELSVEIVNQRYGAFDGFEPVDIGEETNAVELESEFGQY